MSWHQKNDEAKRLLGSAELCSVTRALIHWDQRRSETKTSVLGEYATARLAVAVLVELLDDWRPVRADVRADTLHIYQDGAAP